MFGNITILSEVESMDSLMKNLDSILTKHGYPSNSGVQREKDKQKEDDDHKKAQEELNKMMSLSHE